jgi:glycosyltransferase involved in cell wall biosynthesis
MIVGDGKLFDKTLNPLRKFENISIHKGFLSHAQISRLHKEYGVFLTPTRMDSQGVSRDEAMSSGLVPITTSVTAIPEFVDSESGILVPGEDYNAIADAVINIVNDPALFDKLSSGAAKRVRQQSRSQKIIEAEINLITSEELE